MNKEKYLNKRKQLMTEAENMIDEGQVAEAEAKMKEVEELDTTFENAAKAQANLNALRGNSVVTDISNMGATVKDYGVLDSFSTEKEVGVMAMKDDKKLYNTAFMKTLMGTTLNTEETEVFNSVNEKFRNSTQTAEQHQVLIPETIKEGIWKEIGELHPIFADVRPTYVKGDLTIIKEETEGTDAEWVDEKTEGTDADTAFGTLSLTGCELVKSIRVSWKMKKMSIEAYQQYIITHLAEKMARALAFGILKGKGKPSASEHKPQPKGIIPTLEGEGSTPQVVQFDTNIKYKDLTNLMSKIKSGYLTGAVIYANNKTIWNQLANVVDANGRPLFIPDVTNGGVGRILSVVVKEEDVMEDDELLLGNVGRGYVMNINENVTLYQEDHVKARATDYMTYAIVDGDVLTTKAFALLKKQ